MTVSVFRRKDCRMCGGVDLELVLHLAPTPVGAQLVSACHLDQAQETYPLDLFVCHSCGYIGLLDVVDREVIYIDSTETTSRSLGLAKHLEQLGNKVLDLVKPPKNAFVVDIGSNDGTLLKFFLDRGLKVLGIDPARGIAQEATASGIETVPTFFSADLAQEIRDQRGPAAVVTANRVFANVDDLVDMTAGIRRLLSPDGLLFFETGYVVDMVRNSLIDTIYHEHLSYDAAKPLEAFFHRNGMELLDIERISVKGGSLRGTVQLAGGPRKVEPSVAKQIELEADFALDGSAPFKALAAKVHRNKCQLQNLIRDLRTKGNTIAGYGASVGCTTLIYHYELGDILSFLVDDDPSNQNLFCPGYHIPILPSAAIYERKPDYVLLMPWRYADVIVQKHQPYLDQGGHFIIPYPKIDVV